MTNICRCGTYNRVRAAIKAARSGGDAKRAGLSIRHRDGSSMTRSSRSSAIRARARGCPAVHGRAGDLDVAVGRGLPSSASTSRSPARRGRQPQMPEINAWVVVKPDDTVVIRIARSEMGQGTLTGLAQLVAEELECDWAQGDDRVSDAGREPGAQARLGQLLDRRQPRHPRIARVRPQGRRGRADDAGAGGGRRMEGPGRRMQRQRTA